MQAKSGSGNEAERKSRADSEFGNLLRTFRLAAGLSQETLAGKASLSLQAVSALERGFRKAPYRHTVESIAAALGLAEADRRIFEAAAERARSAPQSGPRLQNLPRQLTPFFGRDAAIAEIEELVSLAPLVTLVGPGGVGKTRAAVQVGLRVAADWSDGVWFIELGALHDPGLLSNTVSAVLGVGETSGSPPLEALVGYLRRKALMLVFDNCEHLLAPVRDLASRLLKDCNRLGLIATSREALRVPGERVYRVTSLAFPDEAPLTAGEALAYPAVALFVDRARAVDDRFALRDENAAAVGEICRRLEGLPLAIELAAARSSVLSPRALADRLHDQLALLRASDGSTASRHSTMRAVIDWSYGLLAENERVLLLRLSVFTGGCTLEAVTDICAFAPLEPSDVLDALGSLIDKSLVNADMADGRKRYRMLELTREYALERLRSGVEYRTLSRRHAEWYAQIAGELNRDWYYASDRDWALAAEIELDNWRAALRWSSAARSPLLLELAGALSWVWYTFAPGEGRRWIGEALDGVEDATPPVVRAQLQLAEAELCAALGQYPPALAAARDALARLPEAGGTALAVRGRQVAGRALIFLGRNSEGEALLETALQEATTLGNPRLVAMGQKDLGTAHSLRGDVAVARRLYGGALHAYKKNGWSQQAALVAGHLAELEFEARDADAALQRIQEALAEHRALRNERFAVNDLCNMAAYLVALDRFAEARTCAFEALAGACELQLDVLLVWILQHIAALAALRPAARVGGGETRVEAALLVGFVDARVAALGATREYTEQQEYDRTIAALLADLGERELQRLMHEGSGWAENHALASADRLA